MSRLNNTKRGEILEAVITARFGEEFNKINKQYADFANKVYEDHFKKDLKKMESLPNGWLEKSQYIYGQLGTTSYACLTFSGLHRRGIGCNGFFKNKEDCVYRVFKNKGNTFNYEQTHEFVTEFDDLNNYLERFDEEVSKAQIKTMAVLNKHQTVKKLLETWPEIKPFIPKEDAPVQLPAIPVDELNKILQLP